MIFALMVQPLVALNVPAAFASPATLAATPSEHTLAHGAEATSAVNAAGHQDLEAEFSFDILPLDQTGDKLTYGYKVGADEPVVVGTILGKTDDVPAEEVGQRVFSLPAELSGQSFNLYFKNHGNASDDIAKVANISVSGEPIIVTSAPEPTLSFVANHIDRSSHPTSSWRGISVEIKTPDLTDAKSVTVTVDRENGDPDIWVSSPTSTSAIDGLNGASHGTTAPIVIAEGSRTRTSSTSWLTSSAPWTNNQVPQNVTVTVERENGDSLIGSMPIGNVWGTTWADTAAHLPAPAVVVPNEELVTVRPSDMQSWQNGDTRTGGQWQLIEDGSSILPNGSLRLTTDNTNEAKAQLMKGAAFRLDQLGELSYWAKQNSASAADGSASLQLPVMLDGVNGWTTFVYEPYWNGTVQPGQWQEWNAFDGKFWSSRS